MARYGLAPGEVPGFKKLPLLSDFKAILGYTPMEFQKMR